MAYFSTDFELTLHIVALLPEIRIMWFFTLRKKNVSFFKNYIRGSRIAFPVSYIHVYCRTVYAVPIERA